MRSSFKLLKEKVAAESSVLAPSFLSSLSEDGSGLNYLGTAGIIAVGARPSITKPAASSSFSLATRK